MNTATGKSSHQFDHNNECVGCGAHISGPCDPTCPFETGMYGSAVLLRAAAIRLREHPAGVGYDISGALFSAALELVGEHRAAGAADAAKLVLTGFLVDQWGPGAQEIRAEVVYRHGLFAHLPEIAGSLYAAAARHDGIDFDAEAFGEFPTSSAARVSPFAVPEHVEAVPMQVEVAGPDQECPAWWREEPQGRHALLFGDPEDGGIAYCGTLLELEAFVAQQQAALHAAQRRQQAASDTPTTPPPQTDAVVTNRVVTIYDLTARNRAELADELGVDRSVRRLPHARDAHGRVVAGVKLDSQYGYDIEAAVAYARRAGLRYVEVREITFESRPTATA